MMVRQLKNSKTIIFLTLVAAVVSAIYFSKRSAVITQDAPLIETSAKPVAKATPKIKKHTVQKTPVRFISSEKTRIVPVKANPAPVVSTSQAIQEEAVSAPVEPVAPLEMAAPVQSEKAGHVGNVEPDKVEAQVQSTEPQKVLNVVEPEEAQEPLPLGLIKDFWIWGGVGFGFTSIAQTVPNISDVNTGSIGTNKMVNAGFWADNFGLALNYRETPEEIKSSNTVTVTGEAKPWKSISADLLLRTERNVFAKSFWNLRFGIQQQEMPFLLPVGSNIQTSEVALTNLSLGFEYKKLLRKDFRVEWLLRYQHPIASSGDIGSDLKISPKASFDGSVGAVYQIHNNMHLGIFWYNQYQSYKFDYNNNVDPAFSGKQSLFLSTFDLRFGFEY